MQSRRTPSDITYTIVRDLPAADIDPPGAPLCNVLASAVHDCSGAEEATTRNKSTVSSVVWTLLWVISYIVRI